MILRRIATAFRKQDWFTVLIETLIVVFGVFIGLQVNNWNEARSAARIEGELRSTLERDFVDLEAQLNERVSTFLKHQKNVSDLLEIVRTDNEPSDRKAVIALLDSAWSIPLLPSPPASYLEGASTGKLTTLSDPELRRALSSYGQKVVLYQLALPPMRETVTGRESLIEQSLLISADLEIVKSNIDGGIAGYDWDVLKNADSDVQMALVWGVVAEDLARQQLETVRKILELLRKDAD